MEALISDLSVGGERKSQYHDTEIKIIIRLGIRIWRSNTELNSLQPDCPFMDTPSTIALLSHSLSISPTDPYSPIQDLYHRRLKINLIAAP